MAGMGIAAIANMQPLEQWINIDKEEEG